VVVRALTGTITIFASANKAEIKNVNKTDGKEMADHVRQRLSAPKPWTASTDGDQNAIPSTAMDIPDQIRKLGELRDSGMVTPEEFEAKKAELLARM
jgi:Short C-terminal domain